MRYTKFIEQNNCKNSSLKNSVNQAFMQNVNLEGQQHHWEEKVIHKVYYRVHDAGGVCEGGGGVEFGLGGQKPLPMAAHYL